jgi:O-antigen ligase
VKFDAVSSRTQSMILIAAPLVTLLVSPFSSYDPINLVKLLALTSIAFYLLFLSLTNLKDWSRESDKALFATATFFVTWMIVVMFATEAPINQQFWGQFGRNSGFLTYLSLILMLVFTASQFQRKFFDRLVLALLLTNLPVVTYALIQLSGNDPIAWSLTGPFSTLGNVNFSSAFLGMASVAALALVLAKTLVFRSRLSLILLICLNLWVVWESQSSQGLLIFAAGAIAIGFFFVRQFSHTLMNLSYGFGALIALVTALLGFGNAGPAAGLIYSETLLYRFDYWFAGWAMTRENPIFGVGLDSYGDWYRELRGEVATLRTIPDRITNTAHNIYLDISASGGFPLLLAYLIILGMALRSGIKVLRKTTEYQPFVVAIFSTWLAYLLQAAVSINQIGVGIWGWIFTGALIGIERCTRESGSSVVSNNKNRSGSSQIPIAGLLSGALGVTLGFVLAFIPFNADARFKSALASGDLQQVAPKSQVLGATAFHMEFTLNLAIEAGDSQLATSLTDALIQKYPRDFMAWRVKQTLLSSSEEEREMAYKRLREMDPFNPDIQRLD